METGRASDTGAAVNGRACALWCRRRVAGSNQLPRASLQVMLEFENSLLSVVPELKAMPYW